MSIKTKLDEYKSLIAVTVAIVVATVGVLAWAADAKDDILVTQKQEIVLMQAQQALVHDDYYQNGRISRKEDQISESERELDSLEYYIGDDEPTPRESRKIESLDAEILELEQEIEDIKVEMSKAK